MMRHLYCERGTKASTQKGKAVRLVNINSKFDRRQSGNWMHGYPPLTKVSLCYYSRLLLRAFKRSHSRLQKNPIWTFWTRERGVCYTDARPTQVSPRHKLTTEHFKRATVRLWFRDVGRVYISLFVRRTDRGAQTVKPLTVCHCLNLWFSSKSRERCARRGGGTVPHFTSQGDSVLKTHRVCHAFWLHVACEVFLSSAFVTVLICVWCSFPGITL